MRAFRAHIQVKWVLRNLCCLMVIPWHNQRVIIKAKEIPFAIKKGQIIHAVVKGDKDGNNLVFDKWEPE